MNTLINAILGAIGGVAFAAVVAVLIEIRNRNAGTITYKPGYKRPKPYTTIVPGHDIEQEAEQ